MPSLNGFDGIRIARTPQALLSQGNSPCLRQYLHEAQSLEDFEHRQNSLFDVASTTLGFAATCETVPSASRQSRSNQGSAPCPMWHGMIGLPVVFTTARNYLYTNRLELDSVSVQPFTECLQQLVLDEFSQLGSVRIESLIGLPDLLSNSPQDVYCAVKRESQRSAGKFQPIAPLLPKQGNELDAVQQARWTAKQAKWSFCLPSPQTLFQTVGPIQPGAFLLIAYVGWTPGSKFRIDTQLTVNTRQQLVERLSHFLVCDRAASDGEVGRSNPYSRMRLQVGNFAPLHQALTQLQGLQLQHASTRARTLGRSFEMEHFFEANRAHWTAKVQDSDDQGLIHEDTVISHAYDTTWRPDSHAAEVIRIANSASS